MPILSNFGNYKNFGLLIIRVGLGIMFIYHGLPKLEGGQSLWEKLGSSMGVLSIHFAPLFWGLACAIVETVGGLFLILGFWFRPVCVLLIFNLLVAALVSYKAGGLGDASHAIEDGITFIGLLFLGPGKYSIDKK